MKKTNFMKRHFFATKLIRVTKNDVKSVVFCRLRRARWWILVNLIPFVGTLIFIYFAVQPSEEGINEYG